jgi:hypothetical protein
LTEDHIASEVFYGEDGQFGITVATERETFDTGPFVTFEAAQEALHRLVDGTLRDQGELGRRVGVRCVVLADAPD